MSAIARSLTVSSLVLFTLLSVCSIAAQAQAELDPTPRIPVTGYADLHIHMMAEYGFGGAWFWGSHRGPEHRAMESCSGNGGGLFGLPRDHARTAIPVLNEFLGMTPGTSGDTGLHLGKRKGYPSYDGWPRWDTIAHQQVWEGFLKQAHDEGLNILVVSAVNFAPLCKTLPPENRIYDCDDMNAVERQLKAAHRFTREHDWAEIALSPEHAREIIHRGKLAMILAIEVSDLFSGKDWRAQLAHVHDLGVRSIQPVHQLDNRFAGAAPHHFIFKLFQFLGTGTPFKLDSHGRNTRGLTTEGRELLEEMIRRKMLIDIAHLSEKAVKETYQLVMEKHQAYPLYISHGHFREMLLDKMDEQEKTTPDWMIEIIKNTGGMFGLRTGPERMKSYGTVPNDCDGSTRSFAQAYLYGDLKLKVAMGFGSDLNGFIQQLRPRFGSSKETCGAAPTKSARLRQQQAQRQALGRSFDDTGFGQIAQISDIIRELKNFGVDVSNLENSAENFVRMWERTEARPDFNPEPQVANRGLASDKSP